MLASRLRLRIASASRLLETATAADTVRHFSRAKLSERDDDLVHEEMMDRFGPGYMYA
jgi:hypothetical protein